MASPEPTQHTTHNKNSAALKLAAGRLSLSLRFHRMYSLFSSFHLCMSIAQSVWFNNARHFNCLLLSASLIATSRLAGSFICLIVLQQLTGPQGRLIKTCLSVKRLLASHGQPLPAIASHCQALRLSQVYN